MRKHLDDSKKQKLKKFVVLASNQSSATELSAERAERDVDDYFKARYMKNKIGNEYEGVISGVINFGLFVELENTVEGFIPLETIDGNKATVITEVEVLDLKKSLDEKSIHTKCYE